MHPDAAVGPVDAPGHGDVDQDRGTSPKLVQGRGGAVREHGTGAAGEDGGQPATVAGQQVRWDERVDTLVEAMESPARGAFVDGALRQSKPDELAERVHSG